MAESWTTLKVLDWTAARFAREGVDAPRLAAELLLANVLQTDRIGLYTHFDRPLGAGELGSFRELIRRRLAGAPIAYLIGEREFWSLALSVDERVLIPRPDTEILVEVALEAAAQKSAARIADIATGSGAIAIALASELSEARIVACDISEPALEVARKNVARHGLGERVELRCGDLLEPLGGDSFDLLVANLPYLSAGEMEALPTEVKREPRIALDGGEGGLELVERLVGGLSAVLAPAAVVVLEHGFLQGEGVAELLLAAGAKEIELRCDLEGRPRVTRARWPT